MSSSKNPWNLGRFHGRFRFASGKKHRYKFTHCRVQDHIQICHKKCPKNPTYQLKGSSGGRNKRFLLPAPKKPLKPILTCATSPSSEQQPRSRFQLNELSQSKGKSCYSQWSGTQCPVSTSQFLNWWSSRFSLSMHIPSPTLSCTLLQKYLTMQIQLWISIYNSL